MHPTNTAVLITTCKYSRLIQITTPIITPGSINISNLKVMWQSQEIFHLQTCNFIECFLTAYFYIPFYLPGIGHRYNNPST
jgi:hypothetical protein